MERKDIQETHSGGDSPELRIEPEIQHLLHPLTEAEFAGLEADILQRGIGGSKKRSPNGIARLKNRLPYRSRRMIGYDCIPLPLPGRNVCRGGMWGFDCPALDIDFLMLEYDCGVPSALVEFKHENAPPIRMEHPSIRALSLLCNRARLPFFLARYADDFSWFYVTPGNDWASEKRFL